MHLEEDDDFGFSLVSETELKKMETILSEKIKEKEREVETTVTKLNLTAEQIQNKLNAVVRMITPLVNNLMADPSKEYVYWPDRAEKMKKFKAGLDKLLKE